MVKKIVKENKTRRRKVSEEIHRAGRYNFNSSAKAEDIVRFLDSLDYEYGLFQQSDDVMLPWDADVEQDGYRIKLTGHIVPGGASGDLVVATMTVRTFADCVGIEISTDEIDDELADLVLR